MKTEVTILVRATYQSNADSTKKTYTSEDALSKKLGQGNDVQRWVP